MRHLAVWLLGAAAGCASHDAADFARLEAAVPDQCATARDADFEDAGERNLLLYAQRVARDYGGGVSLRPHDVSLAIVTGPPKPGLVGVTAGEVACASGDGAGPYRIALYRDALVGRRLATAYHTVAHEVTHLIQIRRDGLPCGPADANRERYEREAIAVADEIAPACRSDAVTSR